MSIDHSVLDEELWRIVYKNCARKPTLAKGGLSENEQELCSKEEHQRSSGSMPKEESDLNQLASR